MALLDGKQLRDQSTELGKLSGTGIVSFTSATMSFGAGSVLTTATSNIVNGTDVVNKEYVDSVAAGLDPKQSVAYTTTGDITLSGTGTQSGGDWSSSLTAGDRILVKNQTDKTQNGIYTVDGGSWSRAADHDGTPANEVTLGNFTFVEYGSLAGSGYVLHATNAATAPIITPGTDEQEWTLFSSAGAYTAGTGLTLTGGEFKITDTAVSAGSYGQANSATTFTVNDQGQLTAAGTTLISITSSQVTDFDAAAETAVFEDANFVDGTTIDFTVTAGDSVTAEVIDSSLQVSKLNTGSFGGATAGYVLSTDGTNFKWILDEGDISSVTAGSGLTGGGTTGALTLDVNTGNGLSISGDDVVLGGTLSQATTIAGGGQTLDLGLTSSQITFLRVNAIQSQEKYEVPGQGITIDKNPGGMTSQVVSTSGDIADFTLNAQVTESKTTRTDGTYSTVKTGGSYAFIQTTDGSDFSAINTSLNNIRLEQSVVGTSSFSGLKLDRTTGYKFEDARGGTAAVGIEYAGDYSANFTANSLVTKAYVDSLDAAQITGVDAGAGLSGGGTAGTVALSVNTDNGLSIDGDNVVLGGTLSQATTIAGAGFDLTINNVDYLTLDSTNAFDVTSNLVSIDSGTGPSQFLSGTDTTISASSSLNLVSNEGNVTTGNLEGLVYTSDYSSTFVDESLITKRYVDTGTASIWAAINSIDADFVTEVQAGAGLTGGGTEGVINLDIVSANGGIVVNADDIALTLSATNSSALTIESDGLRLDTTPLALELEGTGLTANGGKLSVDLTTNGGLTFSSGQVEVVVDNTTIQVVNGALSVVAGASQPVYQSATSSVATGNTGITLSSTPNTYSRIEVYVNGQLQNLTADTTGDCYFGASGTAFASLTSGDSLYWNSANAGFTLSSTDIVKIHYEA